MQIKRYTSTESVHNHKGFNVAVALIETGLQKASKQKNILGMVMLSTLGYVGAAICVVGWACRKMFTRSFGVHDESDEESVTGKTVSRCRNKKILKGRLLKLSF